MATFRRVLWSGLPAASDPKRRGTPHSKKDAPRKRSRYGACLTGKTSTEERDTSSASVSQSASREEIPGTPRGSSCGGGWSGLSNMLAKPVREITAGTTYQARGARDFSFMGDRRCVLPKTEPEGSRHDVRDPPGRSGNRDSPANRIEPQAEEESSSCPSIHHLPTP